jgi:RecA/RadA recombinase
MTSKEKTKALDMAISQIEKSFGKGAIMRLGAEGVTEGLQIIPTGSLSLDIATGIGGLPRGRVIEIFGPESSGKTTLALNVAQAQMAEAMQLLLMQNMPLTQVMRKTRCKSRRPSCITARYR